MLNSYIILSKQILEFTVKKTKVLSYLTPLIKFHSFLIYTFMSIVILSEIQSTSNISFKCTK